MLHKDWTHKQNREERRAALGAWVTAEVNRDSKRKPTPYAIEDFVAHKWGTDAPKAKPREQKVMSGEEWTQRIAAIRASLGHDRQGEWIEPEKASENGS